MTKNPTTSALQDIVKGLNSHDEKGMVNYDVAQTAGKAKTRGD